MTSISLSNFLIKQNTLINDLGLGVISYWRQSKNVFVWNEHKDILFFIKTGNQNVIKSHDSFSFNPNIFNFSSKNAPASSALTIKPFVKSILL